MKDVVVTIAFLVIVVIIGQCGDFGIWLAIALVLGIITYERK